MHQLTALQCPAVTLTNVFGVSPERARRQLTGRQPSMRRLQHAKLGSHAWGKVPDREQVPPFSTPSGWVSSHPEWTGDDRKCGLCVCFCPERQNGHLVKNKVFYNPQADLPLCLKCNVLVPSLEAYFIKVVRLPPIRGKLRKPLGTLSTNSRPGPALFPGPVEDEGVAEDSDDELVTKGRSKRPAADVPGGSHLHPTKRSRVNQAEQTPGKENNTAPTGEDQAVVPNITKFWNKGHHASGERDVNASCFNVSPPLPPPPSIKTGDFNNVVTFNTF